jgi:hypothetical protein
MNRTVVDHDPGGHASAELLSAYLDRRAEPAEEELVRGHLAECSRCAEELAGLEAVRDLLRRLPSIAPPRSFELPEPAPLLRFPRPPFLVWTRAAAAVAATFFVIVFSLDLLGFGADVPVTPQAQSIRAAAPTRPPAAAPSEAGPAAPSRAPAAAARPSGAAPSMAESADARVESLAATPVAPLPRPASPSPGAPTPLRLASIGTGALALVLIAAALLVTIKFRAGAG